MLARALDGGLSAEDKTAACRWGLAHRYQGDINALTVRLASLLPRGERAEALALALAYCRVDDGEVLVETLGGIRRDDTLAEASRRALGRTVVAAAFRVRSQRRRLYALSYQAEDLGADELARALGEIYPARFADDARDWMYAIANLAEVLPTEEGRRLVLGALTQVPGDDRAAAAAWPLLTPAERLTWLGSGLDRCGDGPVRWYPPLFKHLHPGLPLALLARAGQVARRAVSPGYAPELLLAVTLALPAEDRLPALRDLVEAYARDPDVPCGDAIPFEEVAELLPDAELRRALTVAAGLDESYAPPAMGCVIVELARRGGDPAELEAAARKIPAAGGRVATLAALVAYAPAADRLGLALRALAVVADTHDEDPANLTPIVACRAHLAEAEVATLAAQVSVVLEALPAPERFELLTEPVLDLLLERGGRGALVAALRELPGVDAEVVDFHLNVVGALRRRGESGWEALLEETVTLAEAAAPDQRSSMLSLFEPWLDDLPARRTLPFLMAVLRNEGDRPRNRAGIMAAALPFCERLAGPAGVGRALAVLEGVLRDHP